jgi:hypothetical protein
MPSEQRQREADRRRVSDLQTIAKAIHDRHTRRAVDAPPLPASLPALKAEHFVERIADPETRAPYAFRPKEATQYELCAIFAQANMEESDPGAYASPFWKHAAGESCYLLDASTFPPM